MRERSDQELIKRVAALRHRAPAEFDAALNALREYSQSVSLLCVQSPPEHLQRLQGKAQQCADIVTLFADACKTADRIERKTPRREFSAAV